MHKNELYGDSVDRDSVDCRPCKGVAGNYDCRRCKGKGRISEQETGKREHQ